MALALAVLSFGAGPCLAAAGELSASAPGVWRPAQDSVRVDAGLDGYDRGFANDLGDAAQRARQREALRAKVNDPYFTQDDGRYAYLRYRRENPGYFERQALAAAPVEAPAPARAAPAEPEDTPVSLFSGRHARGPFSPAVPYGTGYTPPPYRMP